MTNKIFSLLILGLLLSGCTLIQPIKPALNDVSAPTDNANLPSDNTTADNTAPSEVEQKSKNKLDLSNQNLSKLPESVFKQTNLTELNISHNQLTGAIQAEIRQLKNLRVLDMSDNQLTGVPAEIGQLSALQVLDLSNNQLTGLPYELGNLKNLQTLNLSGNNYSTQDLAVIEKGLPSGVNIIK